MIQYINYSGNLNFRVENMTVNSIKNPKSLDMYNLNIIDLTSKKLWYNNNPERDKINDFQDFRHLKNMMANSKKSKFLIFLPQDNYFYSGWSPMRESMYRQSTRLRDMLYDLKKIIGLIIPKTDFFSLEFEKTETRLIHRNVHSDFYFTYNVFTSGSLIKTKTESIKSNKITTIKYSEKDIYLSTVKINDKDELLEFLRVLNLISPEKEQEPKWMGGFNMFDDAKQQEVIQMTETEIAELKEKIKKAEEILQENKRYKSVLYTQGDELVNVVFEMLEEMLEVDLSEFEDKKKEDVSFKIGDRIFIGEIKGISDNVKAKNLSQLYNHYYNFEYRHPEIDGSDVYKLLIINHQRKKPLDQRDPVDINQINLAENNMGILIVETSELLKLFEKFRNKKITRDEIIQKLTRFGILKIDEN